MAEKKHQQILNIHCRNCGMPAEYDILRHTYSCAYCGTDTGITKAHSEKQGFRALCQEKRKKEPVPFREARYVCEGCGAAVLFPENEATGTCAFCGRKMIRAQYARMEDIPELVIPFSLTEEEAREQLLKWCRKNAGRKEARRLRRKADLLKGYYLPYELVRGPIDCTARRMEGVGNKLHCGGYLEGSFINASGSLDNHLLQGIEPFDVTDLQEFEYGYLAGQRVRVSDLNDKQLAYRTALEVAEDYAPTVAKTVGTRNLSIVPDTSELFRLPVLLPVYYVNADGICAAVNGQTGKVAVPEDRVRRTFPWQLRPVIATLVTFLLSFLACYRWVDSDVYGALYGAGMFTLVMGLIYLTAWSNAYEGDTREELPQRIFTSGGKPLVRRDGVLTEAAEDLRLQNREPVFFMSIGGKKTPVEVEYASFRRTVRDLLLTVAVMFLPLILAFLLNGFSAEGLWFGGAAVWLCVSVPCGIAYFIKLGRIDIYENPIIRVRDKNGKRKRVRRSRSGDFLKAACTTMLWLTLLLLAILCFNVYLILHVTP